MDDLVKHHPYLDENVRSKSIRFWNLTIPGSGVTTLQITVSIAAVNAMVMW